MRIGSTARGVAVALMLGIVSQLVAEEAPVKRLALVNAAGVSEKMAERLRAFAQNELDVPVRGVSIQDTKSKTLHEAGKPLLAAKEPTDVCLIALIKPEGDVAMHMALLPDIKVAVVNAKTLAVADEELYARRLERQVIRSAAFLLGLTPCPEPRDVTHNYRSLAELDKMGRNFSAPWRKAFLKAAEAQGLRPAAAPQPPAKQQAPATGGGGNR